MIIRYDDTSTEKQSSDADPGFERLAAKPLCHQPIHAPCPAEGFPTLLRHYVVANDELQKETVHLSLVP